MQSSTGLGSCTLTKWYTVLELNLGARNSLFSINSTLELDKIFHTCKNACNLYQRLQKNKKSVHTLVDTLCSHNTQWGLSPAGRAEPASLWGGSIHFGGDNKHAGECKLVEKEQEESVLQGRTDKRFSRCFCQIQFPVVCCQDRQPSVLLLLLWLTDSKVGDEIWFNCCLFMIYILSHLWLLSSTKTQG